jgi:hypothetical protein
VTGHIRIVRMAGKEVVCTRMVAIGSAYVPPPMPVQGRDAEVLQRALLDPRTSTEPTAWRRALAAVWRWC